MLTTDLMTEDDYMALEGAFLAQHYHGGMMTALYALASCGSLELFPGEGLARIIRELDTAVSIAESDYPDDLEALEALRKFCVDLSAR